MWRNRATSAAPHGLLLVGVVLVGFLAAAAEAQVWLEPTRTPSVHRMRRSLLSQSLTCDGKIHELSYPDTPYPDTIPFAPIVNQPFFACHRPKQGLDAESNGECGAAPRYECENHVFEPVMYGSGQTPGIISPNNPVTIALKEDSDFYLTHLEWTAVDVGTAGARLRGLYSANSDLSPVTVNYAWTWNGRNALGEFGPCSSCKHGQGIKNMNVSAISGAGFRSFQLSQMFVNTQCAGGSGVNYDGLYWHGMKYACVRPTCGDTDLDTADAQRYSGCSPSTAFMYNPKSENNTIISTESCCLPVTCDNISPVKAPGQAFTCPNNREFDPSKASVKGPSVENCCSKPSTCDDTLPISAPGLKFQCPEETTQYDHQQNKMTPPSEKACCMPRTCANYNPITNPGEPFECPADTQFDPSAGNKTNPDVATCCRPATCANVSPVKKPGVKFACPAFREFDPSKAANEAPNADRCCSKVAHCSDISPISKPGTAFKCPADTEYNPVQALVTEPNQEKCCQASTCADVSPVNKPGVRFVCPDNTEYNPAMDDTFPPRLSSCCKRATCADVNPVSKPGVKFECPVHTEFVPEAAPTFPPTQSACCKVATCQDVQPISSPGKKYKCPAGTQYNPQAGVKMNPSTSVCCVAATCNNVLPISKPGIKFACPNNRQFDPEKLENVMPSDDNCCSKPNSCDDITPISEPGVKFECPAFREFDPAKAGNSWPNEDRCCSKVASCGDVHPISAPGTRFACPADSEFNPAAANTTLPDEAKCCKRATCGNMRPVSKAGVLFACPEFSEYDPSRTMEYPPRPESCCKAATCADIKPISKAGVKFVCPADREYNPAKHNNTSPTVDSCCSQAATCANTKPITAAGTAFTCPNNKEFDPARAGSAPVGEDTCCSKAFTCGAIRPVTKPGKTFNCAPFREFDPEKTNNEKPSEGNCCSRPKTCGDFLPVSKPGTVFPCGNFSEYNPIMSDAWPPSEQICCKPASCGDVKPISSPGERYTCPKLSEYDEAKDETAKPSADTCCRAATCANMQPLSKPGVKFVCPPDMRYNAEADKTKNPSAKTCCQSIVDVYVKKDVTPSSIQRAGSILLYRVEVGVRSNVSQPAQTVTLVDAMPEGMALVAVVEEPDEGACKHDESGITCIWDELAPKQSRLVTITANATRSGLQPSIAAVTTSSVDTDPTNNKAAVEVSVLGACCSKDADGQHTCSETLPDACTGGFMPRSTCTQKNICALAPESGIFGEDEITPNDANLEAFEQISFAASKLEKLGKGACCLDEQCIDNIKKEHCSGMWSNGQSCDAVQCGAFRIASATGTELPKTAVNPASMLLGSCCVDGQCMEGVESDCAGIWNSGAKCSDVDCARSDSIPRGACCNPQDGSCSDGVEETACPAPAKWTKDGKCQPNGVCTGACCDGGKCSQKLKKDCPGEWTLYKDCKLDTCPRPAGFVAIASLQDEHPMCIPKWQQCGKARKINHKESGKISLRSLLGLNAEKDKDKGGYKSDYECCEGTTCQYTYEGCKAGRFVCKPKDKCVKEQEMCGGNNGGHCCKGLTCVWDYGSKTGTCKKVDRCIKEGGKCQSDSQCCKGNRCKNGECSAPICWKRCSDYRCYNERKKDCEAVYAAAASA